MRRRIRSAALPLHRHTLPQLAVDGALVALAYYLAFQLRFNNGPTGYYAHLRERTIWWVLAGSIPVLVLARVYQRRWRYSGQRDYEAVVRGVLAIVVLTVVAVAVVRPVEHATRHGTAAIGLPNGVIVLFALLALAFLVGVRALARSVYERRPLAAFRGGRKGERSVLIAGAGDGGRLVLREIRRNRGLGLAPVGFLDDDPHKRRLRIDGVRVRGNTEGDLARILDDAEPDEVIIAIPSAPGSTRARIVRECRERGIPVRTLPTVFELLQTRGALSRQMREVRVEDVLGREPVQVELERVGAYLAGQTVLVTGAGGSIGSELCRQIARVEPHRIVLLDHAEDNLFSIERELQEERHVSPSMLSAVLADCKEEERMREVFAAHRPTVVFHAAAYKHVGLMEANPVEAVRNNAIATRVVAHVAGESAVACFILVSTDKAVAPATVMGASKALAEFALEAATARFPGTRFAAVRFGNVLGSSGSVVPIFRRQIERGGPVTVTDERMTRYFMTIPEAVQLIISSGSLACAEEAFAADPAGGTADTTAAARRRAGERGGGGPDPVEASGAEVFVLDMGEPVCILELAREMIGLSGLDPERDIAIEIVGRRPGEKLHEELFNSYETPRPTTAEKILLAEREPLGAAAVESIFSEIGLLVLEGDAAGLAAKVSQLSAMHVESPPAPVWRRPERQPSRPDDPLDGVPDAPAALSTLSGLMTALPLALSLSNTFTQVGAIAAFAALFGIAILSLLAFSQARELKRLREWAGRAPERAAEVEQRVTLEAAARLQQPRGTVQAARPIQRAGAVNPAGPSAAGSTAAAGEAAAGVAAADPAAAGLGAAAAQVATPGAPTSPPLPATHSPPTPATGVSAVPIPAPAASAGGSASPAAQTSPSTGEMPRPAGAPAQSAGIPLGTAGDPPTGEPATAAAAAGAGAAQPPSPSGAAANGPAAAGMPPRAPAPATAAASLTKTARAGQDPAAPIASSGTPASGTQTPSGASASGDAASGARASAASASAAAPSAGAPASSAAAPASSPPVPAQGAPAREPAVAPRAQRAPGAPARPPAPPAPIGDSTRRAPTAAAVLGAEEVAEDASRRARARGAAGSATSEREALSTERGARGGGGAPPRGPRGEAGASGRRTYKASRTSPARATVLIVGGVLVGLAILVAVLLSLGGGSSSKHVATAAGTSRAHRSHTRPASTHSGAKPSTPATSPGATNVAVLNGTGTTGLAHQVSSQLQQSGYSQATALNGRPPGANQVTVVEYANGHHAEAQGVARALGVAAAQPMEATVASLSGSANVAVIVGLDKAGTSP